MSIGAERIKVRYFGIYDPGLSRNRVYISGLKKAGCEVTECREYGKGIFKYLRMVVNHLRMGGKYDVMIVGYPGHSVVPLARLVTRKPLILDALCSKYEAEIISRRTSGRLSPRRLFVWLTDYLAYKLSDLILVESESQRRFISEKFGVPLRKLVCVYTGADDSVFYHDLSIEKRKEFTAIFRGRLMPEAGLDVIVRAAKILEDKGVRFLMVGWGILEEKLEELIEREKPNNLEWIREKISYEDIRALMLSSHVSLGQFADHERLARTIPHKAYESMAMGMPFITADAAGIREIAESGGRIIFTVPGSAEDLADKILRVKEVYCDEEKAAAANKELFLRLYSPEALGLMIAKTIRELISGLV